MKRDKLVVSKGFTPSIAESGSSLELMASGGNLRKVSLTIKSVFVARAARDLTPTLSGAIADICEIRYKWSPSPAFQADTSAWSAIVALAYPSYTSVCKSASFHPIERLSAGEYRYTSMHSSIQTCAAIIDRLACCRHQVRCEYIRTSPSGTLAVT